MTFKKTIYTHQHSLTYSVSFRWWSHNWLHNILWDLAIATWARENLQVNIDFIHGDIRDRLCQNIVMKSWVMFAKVYQINCR